LWTWSELTTGMGTVVILPPINSGFDTEVSEECFGLIHCILSFMLFYKIYNWNTVCREVNSGGGGCGCCCCGGDDSDDVDDNDDFVADDDGDDCDGDDDDDDYKMM